MMLEHVNTASSLSWVSWIEFQMKHLFLYNVFYFASLSLSHFIVSLPCSRRVGLEMKETNKCLVSSTKNKWVTWKKQLFSLADYFWSRGMLCEQCRWLTLNGFRSGGDTDWLLCFSLRNRNIPVIFIHFCEIFFIIFHLLSCTSNFTTMTTYLLLLSLFCDWI
jgi:hypothetical protein